jgi:serine/threonine protein kinase
VSRRQYRLLGRLETGELAELYKAQINKTQTVVMKLFHRPTSTMEYARSLADTSRALSGLTEVGILHELEIGMARGRLAVVRETFEGFTLGTALQRLSTKEVLLPPQVALYLVIQLLEAVEQAHQAGVIHGAITPGNVILSQTGQVGICDFGALRALQAAPALKAFLAKGRSTYRAPELSQGAGTTAASDVYSLGAITYELLTLREATTGRPAEVSTRRDAIPPPSRLDRRINSRLDAVVMRTLEAQPGRRYKSCAELATALRNVLGDTGGMPTQADMQRFVTELYPNEVTLALGPVPFSDSFPLQEVRGADLHPDVTGEVAVRQSFSAAAPPLDEHETMLDSLDPGMLPPMEEPEFDDGTEPGQGGGTLDMSWDAPAARTPVAARRSGAKAGVPPKSQPGFQARVRVLGPIDVPATPSTSKQPVVQPISDPPSSDSHARIEDSYAPSAPSFHFTAPSTAELRLAATQKRRRSMGMLTAAIAVFGLAGVAVFLGLSSFTSSDPPRNRLRVPVPLGPTPGDPQLLAKQDPRPPPHVEPAPHHEESPRPAAGPNSGFLTIETNVAAKVYVDDRPLGQTTPLKAWPVDSGPHRIGLRAVSTGETKDFSVRVEPGKVKKVEENDFAARPRR